MLKMLARAFGRKASATTRLHVNAVRGADAVWTPRKFDQLIREGYQHAVWAYACVSHLTRMVKPTSWIVQVGDDEADEHPLLDLLNRPNPFQGGGGFLEAAYGFVLTSGNAYIERVGTESRAPAELWVKRPDRMRVLPHPKDLVRGYEYTVGQESVRFDRWQVRHLKTWHPLNDWYGMSPLEAAARGVDLFNEGAAHNLALIQNGARPSGAWVTQGALSDEQIDHLRAELSAASDPRERGRPMLLEGGTTWQELGLNPKDLDYLAGQEDAARQIHAAFGVHPVITGLSEGTFENQRQAMRALMVNSVLPFLDYLTSELNDWLAPLYGPRVRLSYDRDAFPAVSEDQESLWERAATGWSKGFLTRNEARAIVGFDEIEDEAKGSIFVNEMYGTERQVPGLPPPPPDATEAEPEVVRARKGAFRLTTDKQRAAYWRARVNLQDDWTERLEREVADVLDEERRELIPRLRAASDEAGAVAAVRAVIKPERWEERMLPWVLAIMQAGGDHALEGLDRKSLPGLDPSFPATFGLVFTEAIEHARTHVARLAGDVTRTTLDRVTRGIHAGASEGLSMPHIADRIDDRLLEQIIPGQSRATVIARTETIRASNYGSQAAARGTGLNLKKVWLATLDGRQRESHGLANGQTKPLDTPYDVGGAHLRFPGDPNGPGEETIECRCTEYYEEDASAVDEPALDEIEEFAPATNLKDAEAYATKRFGVESCDYSQMPLDAANEMNRTLTGLTREYGRLEHWQGIRPYGPSPYGMEASCMRVSPTYPGVGPVTLRLEYNPRLFKDIAELRAELQVMRDTNWIRGMDSVRDLVTHEYGHLVALNGMPQQRLAARAEALVAYWERAMPGKDMAALMRPVVGDYAFTIVDETFAEFFRAYHTGMLPKGAEAIQNFFASHAYLGGVP